MILHPIKPGSTFLSPFPNSCLIKSVYYPISKSPAGMSTNSISIESHTKVSGLLSTRSYSILEKSAFIHP